MRKILLFTMLFLAIQSGQAQPTPRPGRQKMNTPVLLPKGGSSLSPYGQAVQNRSEDDSILPAGNTNQRKSNASSLTMDEPAPHQLDFTTDATRTPRTVTTKRVESTNINWISIEEAIEKSKTEKRKVVVDVYTDWCGWCKRMDQTTFADPKVVEYVNANYYAVKFNAEQPKDIVYQDKTFKFKKNGSRGYHELAALWLNNRLGYPTVVFLDEDLNVIQPIPGYQTADKFQTILKYFGSDSHKSIPWETYERKSNVENGL